MRRHCTVFRLVCLLVCLSTCASASDRSAVIPDPALATQRPQTDLSGQKVDKRAKASQAPRLPVWVKPEKSRQKSVPLGLCDGS